MIIGFKFNELQLSRVSTQASKLEVQVELAAAERFMASYYSDPAG